MKYSPGLINWWPMVGWQGSLVAHDMMKRKNAPLTNMAPSSDWVYDGSIGGMTLDFDGSDDYLDMNLGTGLRGYIGSSSPFTVSCWFMTRDVSTRQCIFGDWDVAGTNQSMSLEIGGYLQAPGTINAGLAFPSSSYVNSGVSAANNVWYHAAVTYDGTNQSIYVNGVYKAQAASGTATGTDFNIAVAGGYPFIYLNGRIADFRLWNRQLGAGEIHQLWHPRTRWSDLRTISNARYQASSLAHTPGILAFGSSMFALRA